MVCDSMPPTPVTCPYLAQLESGRSGTTSGGGGVQPSRVLDPPLIGDALSQSDGDVGGPGRESLFRPQPVPVGLGGFLPPAGASSVFSYSESLHTGFGILFGESQPALGSQTENPSPNRDVGGPGRESLFCPQPVPVGPGGVLPPAGASSVFSYSESLHTGFGILFGESKPALGSQTENPSPNRVFQTVPTVPREPPGGSSSRASHSSGGVTVPGHLDDNTHVVRTEAVLSLQGSPALD